MGFPRRAIKHHASYGITTERLITDNGTAYRSTIHAIACGRLGIRHLRTRPCRPQTAGKGRPVYPHDARRLGLRRDLPLRRLNTTPRWLAGWLAGWTSTIAAHTAPSATSHPMARLHELNHLPGSYS